jgi:hypothetical protein
MHLSEQSWKHFFLYIYYYTSFDTCNFETHHIFIQGVMALVLYTILRNPCMQKCYGPQKSNYPLNTGTDGLSLPSNHTNVLDIGSLKGSRASILNEVKCFLHSTSSNRLS